MICDITTSVKANCGLIGNFSKCDVEKKRNICMSIDCGFLSEGEGEDTILRILMSDTQKTCLRWIFNVSGHFYCSHQPLSQQTAAFLPNTTAAKEPVNVLGGSSRPADKKDNEYWTFIFIR